MKRKTKITISLFAVLLIALAAIGTIAYFSESFSSDNNVATAASFNVDVVNKDGQTIGDGEFDLGDKLYPGVEGNEVYSFRIIKGDTDVPVEYSVNLNTSGALFPEDNSSPVVFTVQRNVGGSWVDVDSSAISPEKDEEDFRILVSWPHGDNDIDFQGATGTVKLEVVATQVDGHTPEEARAMLNEVEEALEALDFVHNDSFITRGNFSKAESDAVQKLLDEAREYIHGVTSGKAELITEADSIQQALDEKVDSRYVYYEIIEEETNFTQLQMKLSADHSGQVVRVEEARPLWVAAIHRDGEKFWTMRNRLNPEKVEVGDVYKLGLRFNGGVRTIDVTFTNLGDGNWGIESDWLVEKEK